jgi:hypothetical protein
MKQSDRDFPEEFGGIVEHLRAHRAELSPLDLDRIKRASRDRAVGKPRLRNREATPVMRTRSSILAVLASGILLSGGGAAMGISGLASSGSASQAQYLQTGTPGGGKGAAQVLGAHATAPTHHAVRGTHATVSPSAVAQPTRQQSIGHSGSLPFTGYAAIPVLLLGLALLGTGFVMRRRTHAGDDA